MGQTTGIEWTDATWNPVRGCSRVSEGCRNCYAERQAARFAGPQGPFDIAWARNTIAQCKSAGVACFVKQLGSAPRALPQDAAGWPNQPHTDPFRDIVKLRNRWGGDWNEWPEDLRVREFPA